MQLELLYETFHTVLEDHAPLINPSRKQQQLSKKPWMTANIHKLVRKKNKMFHKVYNKKQTYAYSVYKQFRNSLNRTIKIAKNSYYEKLINHNKNNSKKLWQSLGHLINFKSKTNKVQQSVVSGQGDLFAVLGVANIFFAPQSANPQRKLNSFAPHPQGPQV